MLDVDFDELELGSRRENVQYVAFAPPLTTRPKHSPYKRCAWAVCAANTP